MTTSSSVSVSGRATLRRALLLVVAAAAFACGGGPSNTTAPSPSVSTLTVTGVLRTLNAGETLQLSATARMSDGATEDISTVAVWESANTAVATVSNAGLVTARGAGDVDIRATHKGATGQARVSVSGRFTGRVVDVLSGNGLGGVTVKIDNGLTAVTGADGAFDGTGAGTGEPYRAVLSGAALVERQTQVRVPGPAVQLSLIPASFDLASFDEMARGANGLRRWTSAPKLVIIDGALQFTSENDDVFVVADGRPMSSAHYQNIVNDLTAGLRDFTDGRFTAFESVTREPSTTGARVSLDFREGTIVAACFKDMAKISNAWGWGSWWERGPIVVGGTVMIELDADYTPYRTALWVHELGHAMGYHHVTRRQSVMSTGSYILANAWDRDAARVAYSRSPGSASPDRDPDSYYGTIRQLPPTRGPILR